jgi:hypothetical protein
MSARSPFAPLRLLAPLVLLAAACSSGETATSDDDLTSLSARERSLEFQGLVYVSDGAADSTIMRAIQAQTRTAFGALRTQEVAVNNRELKEIDARSIKKRSVTAIDTEHPTAAPRKMLEVKYVYRDRAIVPVAMARRSTLAAAVMSPGYEAQTPRVLRECTANDKDARDFADMLWYSFEPTRASCRKAMKDEQTAIDAARRELDDPKVEVPLLEVDRLYRPITVELGPDKTTRGLTFPDYHRLFAGGVVKDKLVVALVNGYIDHHKPKFVNKDFGYAEWLKTLKEVFDSRPGFELVDARPAVGFKEFKLGTAGKVARVGRFQDILAMELDDTGYPEGLNADERTDLKRQFSARAEKHWLTFEAPVRVSVGGGPEKDFGIQLTTYFGSEEDVRPFKHAFRNADVVVYNGHSYVGAGPMDPTNYSADDFTKAYQILFFDSCVSFNYYEKDFFALKGGGAQNLDLITNGMESPADESGPAQGRFIASLMSGRAPSYRALLETMTETDALRVVDGEIGNEYSPDKPSTKVSVRQP